METYEKTIDFEGRCSLDIAKTMVAPIALKHQRNLAKSINLLKKASSGNPASKALKNELLGASTLVAGLYGNIGALESALSKADAKATLAAMVKLRECVDALENEVDDAMWPMPKYRDMLFVY
jgi:glutamine synthetase